MTLLSEFEHVCGLLLHRSPLPSVDSASSETQNSLHKKNVTDPQSVFIGQSDRISYQLYCYSEWTSTPKHLQLLQKARPLEAGLSNSAKNPLQLTRQPASSPHRGPPIPLSAALFDAFPVPTDLNAHIQQLVDERMQQMMLAPPMAPPPTAASTMTTVNTSGTSALTRIFDSGVSCHMTPDESILIDCQAH